MTFEPQLIDNTTPGESLRSGADKINSNFEAIEDEFDALYESITLDIVPDQFEVLYSPDSYTPTLAATATTAEQLASHLKGIDLILADFESRIAALE